jgi:hypothetical protein
VLVKDNWAAVVTDEVVVLVAPVESLAMGSITVGLEALLASMAKLFTTGFNMDSPNGRKIFPG